MHYEQHFVLLGCRTKHCAIVTTIFAGGLLMRMVSIRYPTGAFVLRRAWIGVATIFVFLTCAQGGEPVLRAGAAMIDITPRQFPVRVNGMVEERTATMAHDVLMSRAIVLDDGNERIAIVVVDSLMLPRKMLDAVKHETYKSLGIPTDRILISATHTHSAPSAMPCLGSREDPRYSQFLPEQIVRSIKVATENMTLAKVGWSVVTDDQHNHCRRWIFREDKMTMTDPFGQLTVRAHMHPGHVSPNHVGESGPSDTDLTLLSIQTLDGTPLAVLANYAMHYYGSPLVSGDCCGRFGAAFAQHIGASKQSPAFVGIMSQGTSGDSMWPDYGKPSEAHDLDVYTKALAESAFRAYQSIEYRTVVTLAMAESTLTLNRRIPDKARLAWAREIVSSVGDRLPRGWSEVYAFEQLYLHEDPKTEIKLQAIRIGDFGITAIPNEVFGITGIKLKNRSPLKLTMNIELANGAEGYIPPPEQHALGGYTTWPARTAGLEFNAEPLILETLTGLLEKVSGKPCRIVKEEGHEYSQAVTASKPLAYWRLGDIDGTHAVDAVGDHHGLYESGVAYYLPGPVGSGLTQVPRGNRSAHFAGGRLSAKVPALGNVMSVECWVWNGLPNDAQAVTGYFFSRGSDGDEKVPGDHLGIGGSFMQKGWNGKLLLFNGNERDEVLVGKTELVPHTWNHVVLVRNNRHAIVYLNGNPTPEISGELEVTHKLGESAVFFGGRTDRLFGLQGRLDEVALYDRALPSDEVCSHYAKAGVSLVPPTAVSSLPLDSKPQSPEDSLLLAHVREGFQVQLVAAEPMVRDPVAIDWGPDGRLWVAEMADYPLGMNGNGTPGGRIRFLDDTDGNGTYDTSTVLLENVSFPTGVMAWGRGVLVTAAPEIFYAEDSDGDGKADIKRTLFSGFLEGNQQLRVNGLRWGLDNWVYCASGSHHAGYGENSHILSHITQQKTAIGSRDFCIQPDLGLIDPQSGPSQFGRNRDAWGNWFGVQNSFPLWHYVLEDPFIRRNPHFSPPDPRHQVVTPANPPVYPAAVHEKRFHSFEQSGRFTSACSGMIYQDDLLFGPALENATNVTIEHAFTCEPFSNLVQHNVIVSDGVSFRFERDPQETAMDFFASEDRWCRPVMARTGPDGGLWIVDMYRYMIEHPQWLPQEGQDELRPFFRSGEDRGRIYRIVPTGTPSRMLPRLDQMSTEELVVMLESSNAWHRDTAQRLLVTQQSSLAKAPLDKIVLTSPHPLARMQALCTLDGLNALTPQSVLAGLKDSHAGVRRQAVRLANKVFVSSETWLELVHDSDAKVRLQVACNLGGYSDPSAGKALASLLIADTDPFIHAAAMSSLTSTNVGGVLQEVLLLSADVLGDPSASERLLKALLSQVAALADDQTVIRALNIAMTPKDGRLYPWQMSGLAAMLDRVAARGWDVSKHLTSEQQILFANAFSRSRLIAVDPNTDENYRAASLSLLLRQPEMFSQDKLLLLSLLVPQSPVVVQQAVVNQIATHSDETLAAILLAGWSSHSPSIRTHILSVLASRESWAAVLVDHLERKSVLLTEIDAPMRQRLMTTTNSSTRERMEKLFVSGTSTDRKQVLESWKPALSLSGDAVRGATLFLKTCSTCHRQEGIGHDIGPNLASLTTRTAESIFHSILDPSISVEAKYQLFVVTSTSGRSAAGLLSAETASSITLLAAEGKTESLLRTDIEELRSTGRSMMPDGLEKDLSHQGLADLIEYVRLLH